MSLNKHGLNGITKKHRFYFNVNKLDADTEIKRFVAFLHF